MNKETQSVRRSRFEAVKTVARLLGICLAGPMFVWFFIGMLPIVPSIIDTFGVANLRIPAAIAIGGLVLAAFGYEDF